MAPRQGKNDDDAFETVYKRHVTCCVTSCVTSGSCDHGSHSSHVSHDLNNLRNKISLCEQSINHDWKPVHKSQLPNYLNNSRFIINGHRPQLGFRNSLMSIFRWHTETINIWSHLIGCVMFVALGFEFFSNVQKMPETSSTADKITVFLWFAGQIICCGFSTLYHTFTCYSCKVSTVLVRCDYIGIFASCWSTLITTGYFSYYCCDHTKFFWYGLAILVAIVGPYLVQTENNFFRVVIYAGIVLPNFVAFKHALNDIEIFHPSDYYPAIKYLIGTYGFPLSGAFVYLNKIPEKYFPGMFDFLGHSHQLMHFLVLACMLSQYQLLLIATRIRFYGSCDL